MRLLSILLILAVLNGCASIKECAVKPTVTIDKSKEKTAAESSTDNKPTPGTIIQDIKENAVTGGQVRCSF